MERPLTRRDLLGATGGGFALGLAGCLGDDDSEDADGEAGSDNGGDDHDDSSDADHDDHDSDEGNEERSDEGDVPGSEGLAYAFAPDRIALIDPEAGEVIEEITEGIDGAEWGDTRITRDHGEIYAVENGLEQVLVIDTETRSIAAEVDIGPGATHIYTPVEGEIWAHADGEGAFYVIDTASREVSEVVDVGLDGEGHGKLLYHEDFGDTGYAMNVNDPAVHVVDLDAYERTDSIELDGEGGTHYKAYAPETGLVYAERTDGGTAVIDADSEEVVDELDISGGMYLSPDEEVLAVLDGDEVHLLDATSEDSEVLRSIAIEGGPDALRYHETDALYGFTANTMTPDASVIDLEAGEEVDRLDAGDIERPDDAHHLHRSGVAGGGYFFTPADADGAVTVIDMDARELVAEVSVADGVDTVQYVGDSGTGYTGR